MADYLPGQRWFSSAEPELGLGTVMRVAGRQVQIVFTGTGLLRHYALGSAPLVRAAFRAGDRIQVHGASRTVERIEADAGLLRYHCGSVCYAEGELDAEQPVSQADARLLGGRVDRNDRFELRREVWQRRAEARAHPGWGILGARVELVPHQLRVAETAASRRPPRLLLADEVGLGKTIEACLVTAQLLASGRARRVLLLVPESLVNQWFVELLRRFNLAFAIYDEERCESLELAEPRNNPFEDEQCVIASIGWLAGSARRSAQVLAADWDLLLVDEAHHLEWSPDEASPAYRLAEALAAATPALLLLTATPEQLGLGGHFARLRLLDPARYTDLDAFVAETERFLQLSALAERLQSHETLTAGDIELLAPLFPDEADALAPRLARIAAGDAEAAASLLSDLVDRHGTGRVMVRNRRAAVGGFPQRIPHITILGGEVEADAAAPGDEPDAQDRMAHPNSEAGMRAPQTAPHEDEAEFDEAAGEAVDPSLAGRLRAEFAHDVGHNGGEPTHDYARDPRTDWLLDVLARIAPAKALLLCRSRAKVQALEEALRLRSGLPVARFHEDMNLLQRDRNAAYFAEPDGARLLLASEIGAEGRNFQFAQHLILWDLPLDPDMVEQRIGRLDRIGQAGDVHVHVAAVAGSAQEALLRWLHEGMDKFATVVADGRELVRRHGEELVQLALQDPAYREPGLTELIERTRASHAELADIIARGRDRLLELGSGRGGGELLAALRQADAEAAHDDYALRLLEAFGVQHEPLSPQLWLLDPEYQSVEGFEELKSGARPATLERATALARDDLLYLRPDHPMLRSAQELLLSGETGNAAFLVDDSLPPRSVLLETLHVVECVAPAALNAERFLPPQPLRVVVDTRLQVRADFVPSERAVLRAGDRQFDLSPMRKILATLVPPMLERARTEAVEQAAAVAAKAAAAADALLGAEIARLEALARVNPAVRPAEIEALRSEREQLQAALPAARPRLDALRLVASPDFLSLRR
jgi:ATP-dependent helicase HepA